MDHEIIPDTTSERVKLLEAILIAAATGSGEPRDDFVYRELRREFMRDATLKPLLPDFVRSCRDLGHFWPFIKEVSPQWAPRRRHIRDAMTPLFDLVEGTNKAPIDDMATDVLQSFDAEGILSVWQKALARRHADAEGALTTARTLLETVCKRVLDEAGETYSDKDDLPALHRKVATLLNIAPSQHTEPIFKQILGGATAVVEGLGALRNKIGDAHGQGKKPIRPSSRHAQLAVNLSGAMATFIVETWLSRAAGAPPSK